MDLLRAWVTLSKPNIITISETWPLSKITDGEFKLILFCKELTGLLEEEGYMIY